MRKLQILFQFCFFWLFLLVFKFGAGLHYALLSPLGEKLMPIWLVGIIVGLGSGLQFLMDIPAGFLLDRFGYKRMLAIGTVAFIVAGILLFQFTTLTFILSVVFGEIGWLFFGPGINAYSLSHAEKGTSGAFLGYRDIFTSIGVVISCVLLPFIVVAQVPTIAKTLVVILVVALLMILLSPRDTQGFAHQEHPHVKTHKQRAHVLRNLALVMRQLNPASTCLMLLNLTGAIFYGVVWFVVPLMIASRPHDAAMLGVGLGMFDFAVVIIGAYLVTVVDRFEKKLMIFLGLLLFSLAGMTLGWSFGLLFIVFAFLATTGDELASLPLWVWLHELDREHDKDGLISGIVNVFEDAGWTVGPMIAGVLYGLIGPQLTIAVAALPILILWIVYQFSVRKHTIHISVLDVPRKQHRMRHKN